MPCGPAKGELQIAYAESFRAIMIVSCALAGLGLLLSLFIESYDLNRALESEQGFLDEDKTSRTRIAKERKEETTVAVRYFVQHPFSMNPV